MNKYEEAFKKIVVAIILLSTGIEIETSQVDLSKMDKDDEIYNIINEAILKAKAFDIFKYTGFFVAKGSFSGYLLCQKICYDKEQTVLLLNREEFEIMEKAFSIDDGIKYWGNKDE